MTMKSPDKIMRKDDKTLKKKCWAEPSSGGDIYPPGAFCFPKEWSQIKLFHTRRGDAG